MFRGMVLLIVMAASVFGADSAGTGGVRGHVVDPTGADMPARVAVSSPANKFYELRESTGSFGLTFISPGDYRVVISAAGFRPVARDIHIAAVETLDLGVIRLALGGCDFPGVICDDFGLGPGIPGPHSNGNIDIEWNCALDLDAGKKACEPEAHRSASDLVISEDSGKVYLLPQHGSKAAIDSHPDWTEGNCRSARLSADAIRIDQFDLNDRVCMRTAAGRYAEIFGFIRLGPDSVRLTFITWN